ncbi:MAG: MATE family efflux transporter [Ruminococcaceae bacterium]|nr:MATE family efflux transporter [Oscillospiraceae bacterium]
MLYDKSVSRICENGKVISMKGIVYPRIAETLFAQLLGTVNTLMLTGYSENAVSAVGVVGTVINFILILSTLVSSGMRIIMSVSIGEKNTERENQSKGTGICLGFLYGIFMAILASSFSSSIVRVMNLSGEIGNMAKGYLSIRVWGTPFYAVNICLNQILICKGLAKGVLFSGIVSNILNVILGYIVLYSGLPLPVDGVNGLALGAVISQIGALLTSYYVCRKNSCIEGSHLSVNLAKDIFRIGVPGTMNSTAYNIAQIISASFIASLGSISINTKAYVSSLVVYTYLISLSIGQANGVLIGIYRGRGDFDSIKKLHRQNIILCLLCNTCVSLLIFIFRKPLISLFTHNLEILKMAGIILLIDIFVEIPRSFNHTFETSILANGDTKATFWISLTACWGFSVLFAYVLGIKLKLGLYGIWIAFVMEEGFKSLCYAIRWKGEKWKHTRI